jgi:hypothetical protein
MSTSDLAQRPAFQNLEEGAQFDQPPFSRLAYVAFVAGLLSLFAAFSTILLPAAMLALGVGIGAVWKLSRDKQLGGRWLAQLGLALSATSIAWSVTARSGVDDYLYAEAAQNAKVLLDTLAAGDKYGALELRQVESGRQLTGTNLAKYYSGLSEEDREGIQEFLNSETTQLVIQSGPQSDWQFARGVDVTSQDKLNYVTVEMVNRASQGKEQKLHVRMKRQLGLLTDPAKRETTALWNFEQLVIPTKN